MKTTHWTDSFNFSPTRAWLVIRGNNSLQKQGNGEPKVGENCTILKKVKFARRRHNDCG